ncbi:hypothetical protein Q5H91_05310 [Sphingomonas sp. KR1UV-12]|uniref:Uncharacterized protein n=1 Tax=Sphingomonas aurea TaxID=3063994 RepID=A0ABT9EI31_9SPHN|nr:hypothetical protein [Sphingomonas sp. KR1UV-12]MDP1026621.1 hypothetical protein [Sphingomonas sp. KR1UV-12]
MRPTFCIMLAAAAPASAQAQAPAPTIGVAGATLTSQTRSGAVTLSVDPALKDGRLSIRIVAANRGDQPQRFGPEAIAVSAESRAFAVATADQVLRRAGPAPRDSALARASAAPVIPGFGQKDTSGAANPANIDAGIPDERFVRPETAPENENARALRAALLSSAMVAPHASLGGAVLTDRVPRKAKTFEIAVTFAGDTHRFTVTRP